MSAAQVKDVRKKLGLARDALAAGDNQNARALTREALALDDASYDAWVFDGKAAFACGDPNDALRSYKLAADLRSDHPAARRGAIEAAEKLAESSQDGDIETLVDVLQGALNLPADDKQLTPERRTEWTSRLARACETLGRHADALARWMTVLQRASADASCDGDAADLAMPEPDDVVAALLGAARCALAKEEFESRADGDVAAANVSSTTIASPAELRLARFGAAKVRAAKPNPGLDIAVRALLHAENTARADDAVGAVFLGRGARAFDPTLDTVMATRAGARLDLAVGADAAGLAALEALDEIERLLMRHGDNPEVRVLARDTALEAAAALDAGWDVEEEGWQETSAFDEESVALTQRVLGVIHLCVSFDPEANHDPTEDPTWTVATIWASFADPNGRGRSGRVAHAPGSNAAFVAFPAAHRAALTLALRRDDSLVAGGGDKSSKEASNVSPAEAGATMLGWGAVAEAAAMAASPSEALDAARLGLKAIKAMRDREQGSPNDATSCAPRAQAAERRLRVVAAEALSSLGRLAEATTAFHAIVPPSPRTTRGLAGVVAKNASSGEDPERAASEALSIFKSSASEFGPSAPRALAELGWAILKQGGLGAASRARRALERAATLAATLARKSSSPDEDDAPIDVATGAPPDIAARLGVARWREALDAGDNDAACARGPNSARAALLAAAAQDGPHRATAFAHLGLVYAASGDSPRAGKCFDRALFLDPTDAVAGPAKCDAALLGFGGDGDQSAERVVETICAAALGASSRCVWAAVRFAPIAASRGDHEASAAALRTVLRACGADTQAAAAAWEALGSSYDAMDKHSAALKAYRKAIALDQTPRVYALARSGRVSATIGDLASAVGFHAGALTQAPNHPAPALGLAEAETARAREAARQGAPARAAIAAARAAASANAAKGVSNPPLRAIAKRSGDAYLVMARLRIPACDSSLSAPARASMANASAMASCRAATRAYATGVHLAPHKHNAWFDLAAACVAAAEIDGEACSSCGEYSALSAGALSVSVSLGSLTLENKPLGSFVTLASSCLRASLRLNPTNPAAWLALGTLPCDATQTLSNDEDPTVSKQRNRARRETALARAVTLDPSLASGWACLGRLYLCAATDTEASTEVRFNLMKRASLALDKARAADADSPDAWIATAALHAANLDTGEAAGAARAAADAGNGSDAHTQRVLWGLRSAGGALRDAPTPTTSLGAAYASARRAFETAPSDFAAALALGLCAEARERFWEAKFAFEDALALLTEASTTATTVTEPLTGSASFAAVVAEEARLGLTRVTLATPESVDPTFPKTFLDPSGLRVSTRDAQRDVHFRPWCVTTRAYLCALLSSSEHREFRYAAHAVVFDAFGGPGRARASKATSTADSATRAAVVAAASAMAATPGGHGEDAVLDARKLARNLAIAIRNNPACVAANDARALAALALARRVVAERSLKEKPYTQPEKGVFVFSSSPSRAAETCGALALVVAKRDPVLATVLLAAASEVFLSVGDTHGAMEHARDATALAENSGVDDARFVAAAATKRSGDVSGDVTKVAASHTDSDAARLLAAAHVLQHRDSRGAESVFREVAKSDAATSSAAGGVSSATSATAKLLLASLLFARAKPSAFGGGGEPKCGKEAGKIMAKVRRGAVVGAVGAAAAARASVAITEAAGMQAS